MIKITDKRNCCGCWACVQVCPKQCISMHEDDEGFLYPQVDMSLCIDCGLCEQACPVLHQAEERHPLHGYAAKNNDEDIRWESSSGGAFSALADAVLADGGVVFGAKFAADWSVIHGYTETRNGLVGFRGSKYVQSRVGATYKEVKAFLEKGRTVLFSGTPCQIAGLKLFLRKEYDRLLTVDFICHGVPSPGVWQQYLTEAVARQCDKNSVCSHPIHGRDALIESISFRNKGLGWKKYSFALTLSATNGSGKKIQFCSPLNQNLYLRGFLANLYLRPSCHECPSKSLKSGSDLTIGDFWGVQHIMPQVDDNKGISVVLVNSERGDRFLQSTELCIWEVDYASVLRFNPSIEQSVRWDKKRKLFYEQKGSVEKRINRLLHESFHLRLRRKLSSLIHPRKR